MTSLANGIQYTRSMHVAEPGSTHSANVNASATKSTGSTVGANDFLTLLVTELKNQDPTANTDPNQYVNQLVQINSLEQLIQINETLSSDVSGASAGTQPASSQGAIGLSTASAAKAHSHAVTSGNLAAPADNPAARRVAQSLGSITSPR